MTQSKHITLVCEYCGKPYEAYAWLEGRSNYCNKACKGLSRRNRVALVCATCGKTYEVRASRAARSKFCSMACAGISRRKPQP